MRSLPLPVSSCHASVIRTGSFQAAIDSSAKPARKPRGPLFAGSAPGTTAGASLRPMKKAAQSDARAHPFGRWGTIFHALFAVRPVAVIAGLALLVAASPTTAMVTSEQTARAFVSIAGATVDSDSLTVQTGDASALARFGSNALPEARAAGRSLVGGEMAANVRLDDKHKYSFTVVDFADGSASYKINVAADSVFAQRAELDFYLPPSFLEITSNAELPQNGLSMSISARLRVCFQELICTAPEDEQFRFEAELVANYFGTGSLDIDVSGAPGLDFTSLKAPTVADTGNASVGGSQPFYRTVTVNFSDFTGHLDLGEIPAGTPLTIEYDMKARGEGRLIDNLGLAGINDPFMLDTDPLPPSRAMSLVLVPVPEPSEFALFLAGGLVLIGQAWRRRRAPAQGARLGSACPSRNCIPL